MKRLASAALVLAGAFSTMPAWADRALLVGINDYHLEHPAPPPGCVSPCLMVGPLAGAVADVQAMRRVLVNTLGYREEDIKVLIDREATAEAIEKGIREWLVAGTRPGERAFFQYSGHGAQVPDDNGDEPDGFDESIIPVDVAVTSRGSISNILRDDQLQAAFAALEGRSFTSLFDSCHSGTVTRGNSLEMKPAPGDGAAPRTPGLLQNFLVRSLPASRSPAATRSLRAREQSLIEGRPGWIVWSAASADQPAWDLQRPLGGFFTQRLIPLVADRGQLGRLTHVALLDRLQAESQTYCGGNSNCRGLVPTLEAPPDWLAQPLARSLLNQAGGGAPSVQTTIAATLPPAGAPVQSGSGTVELSILPSSTVAVGQSVRYRVRSSIAGQLLVLDANAQGQLVQIFPNQFHKGNRIAADQAITVPDKGYGFDEFEASEPLGRGRLIALVTDGSVDLSGLVSATRGLEVIPEARDYLAEIAARLRKAYPDGGEEVRLPRWAISSTEYTITPR